MHCDIQGNTELRCSGCRVLLARRERGDRGDPVIMVRRADVFVDVRGPDASVQVTCYRCGRGNTFPVRPSRHQVAPLELSTAPHARPRRVVGGQK